MDADLFIGEHSNCKYRYVYYLADRKKSKRRNPQKLGKRTVIYGSYYIWNYVDLHNYCFDGFNAGRWKFEWLQQNRHRRDKRLLCSGDQAEDIFNHDSGAATLPDTSEDRPVVDAEPMDGTWEDMSFFFDGHEYSLPFAYSEIEANGWTFDIADYGYEDGYVMNAGDQTYESIELKNPDYPDVTVKIGFVNLDSSAKDITECDIYAFSLDTCYGFDQVDAFPIMSVSGGLTIGMDEQSAVAIMGECDDVYEAEEYNSYSYQDEEYNRHLDFEVNDENGITYFDLTYYQ